VNFAALDLWGARGGLVRAGFTSQMNFLLALARHSNFAELEGAGAGEHKKIATRSQFKTLIHPEGMGETFKVLIQQKGIDSLTLAGFQPL
jgi:SAM-dependent MidA family methyltransferase